MPEMDGYELCRKVKTHDELKSIPVILLTTLSEPEDIIKGLENRADNFVTKPYDPKLLLSRIRHVLVNLEIRKHQHADIGIGVFFKGNKYLINSDRIQILDLLFSTYENALQQKQEIEHKNKELEEALKTIKTLQGLLHICSGCGKIQNEKGKWEILERTIEKHRQTGVVSNICPECKERLDSDIE